MRKNGSMSPAPAGWREVSVKRVAVRMTRTGFMRASFKLFYAVTVAKDVHTEESEAVAQAEA